MTMKSLPELDSFYGSVARLFRGGHLGGIRLFAKNSAEFS